MEKPKRAQRNGLLVLKRQISQVGNLCVKLYCNQDEFSDETTELERCLAQSSAAHNTAWRYCRWRRMRSSIRSMSEHTEGCSPNSTSRKENDSRIKSVETMQIEATRITPRLPQIHLPSFSGNFTAWLSFIDQFRSTLHYNHCHRFKNWYLKSCWRAMLLSSS